MKGRLIALSLLSAAALGSGVQAEDKFQKLTGAQIQAKFAGMEMTDEVHWGAVYQRNGVLITTKWATKAPENGVFRKISFVLSVQTNWETGAMRCGSSERMCN